MAESVDHWADRLASAGILLATPASRPHTQLTRLLPELRQAWAAHNEPADEGKVCLVTTVSHPTEPSLTERGVENARQMLAQVVESQEIDDEIKRLLLDRNEVRSTVERAADEIAEQVTSEFREYMVEGKGQYQVEFDRIAIAVRDQLDLNASRTNTVKHSLRIGAVLSGVGGLTAAIITWTILIPINAWLGAIIAVGPAAGFLGAFLLWLKSTELDSAVYDYEIERGVESEGKVDDRFVAALTARDRRRSRYQTRLHDAAIQLVRAEINKRSRESYSLTLRPTSAPGLNETSDPSHEISTAAFREVLEIINQTSAAAIGLAGRRGAGKSTLLRALYRHERAKKSLVVETSAPVEYTSKEFVLHVFARLCREVLTREGMRLDADPRNEAPSRLAAEYVSSTLRARWVVIARAVGPIAFFSGLVVIIMALLPELFTSVRGFYLWGMACLSVSIAEVYFGMRARAEARRRPSIGLSQEEIARLDARNRTISRMYFALAVAALFPGVAFLLAAVEVVIAVELALLGGLLVSLGSFLLVMSLQLQRLTARGRPLVTVPDDAEPSDLAREASRNLRRIEYVQTLQSNWTIQGKLAAAKIAELSAGAGEGMSMSEAARGFPELVGDFRNFADLVVKEYARVVIGIDELDKIENPETARRFLNELKALFHISGCFFVLTVSEDALVSFERRGSSIRDVFDSSFDDIIEVPPLTLQESYELLYARVFGVPRPFMALVHVLAGGIPRDVIRYLRSVLAAANREPGQFTRLLPAVNRLLRESIVQNRRGLMHYIQANDDWRRTVNRCVKAGWLELPRSTPIESAANVDDLRRLCVYLRELDDPKPALAFDQQLAFEYLCVRVAQMFARVHSADDFAAVEVAANACGLAALVNASQLIATNPTLAAAKLDALDDASSRTERAKSLEGAHS